MILIWNRKEVFMGNSLEKFYEVRQILEANNIEYTYRLESNNSTFLFESRRGVMGTFGENIDLSTMYYIYVHKKNFEFASFILKCR